MSIFIPLYIVFALSNKFHLNLHFISKLGTIYEQKQNKQPLLSERDILTQKLISRIIVVIILKYIDNLKLT